MRHKLPLEMWEHIAQFLCLADMNALSEALGTVLLKFRMQRALRVIRPYIIATLTLKTRFSISMNRKTSITTFMGESYQRNMAVLLCLSDTALRLIVGGYKISKLWLWWGERVVSHVQYYHTHDGYRIHVYDCHNITHDISGIPVQPWANRLHLRSNKDGIICRVTQVGKIHHHYPEHYRAVFGSDDSRHKEFWYPDRITPMESLQWGPMGILQHYV